jgi:hypothetical protein
LLPAAGRRVIQRKKSHDALRLVPFMDKTTSPCTFVKFLSAAGKRVIRGLKAIFVYAKHEPVLFSRIL